MSPTPAVGPRHVVGGGDVADRIKLSPPPLDLTNKSPEPPTAGGNDDMAATAAAKLGLENHLNLLKMKEMEMMKTVPVNRCVFSAFLVFFVRLYDMTTSFFSSLQIRKDVLFFS